MSKIDFLCNDGSPLGVTMKTLWGEDGKMGCGGSEYAMLTLCEQWTKEGHEVCLYNNPRERGASPFEQKTLEEFHPQEDRDILIVFRSPNTRAIGAKGRKIWFSCDQFTNRQFPFEQFAPHVDEIVCISPYHAVYFRDIYGIEDTTVIDLPVRMQDFPTDIEKVKNRVIFTSVPDRGLMHLHAIWPLIKRDVPDASLVITSDYRLWGIDQPRNSQYRVHWVMADGVQFKGAMLRREYLEEICKADIFAYPAKAENAELFCISAAEAQYAGAYPVTSDQGALATTNMGTVLSGDPDRVDFRNNFVKVVTTLLSDRENLKENQKSVSQKISKRLNLNTISKQWSKLFCQT